MMRRLPFGAPLALTIGLMFVVFLPAPARAVNVTVGGITYDVQFFQAPQSFNDNAAAIQAAPWWGSQAVASDFAVAYRSQVGSAPFNVSGALDSLLFAYSSVVEYVYYSETGLTSTSSTSPANVWTTAHYAYVASPSPVPEINGNALAQAGLILLALWLMLRRRGAVTRAT